MQSWSNPLGLNKMGLHSTFDYFITVSSYSNMYCLDEKRKSFFKEETNGKNSFLHSKNMSKNYVNTTSNSDSCLTISVFNISKKCHFEGKIQNFGSTLGDISCSSPQHIC